MQFLALIAAYVLTPFVLVLLLPGWGSRVAAGLLVIAVAAVFAFGPAGTEWPTRLLLTFVAAGVLSGVLTAGIDIALRDRHAPWQTRAVTLVAGAFASVPLWLATLLAMTMVAMIGR